MFLPGSTDLATLEAPADEPHDDPTLLDEVPTLGGIVTDAPAALVERLLAVFDVNAVYNRDKHQLRRRPYQARSGCPFGQPHWVVPG
jgi:hypothetical protein